MKKIIISLLALVCLVACTKSPLKEYKTLTESTIAQMETATSRDIVDSLIDNYVQQSYALLMNNIKKAETDSIIIDLYYMLTPEQKEEVFAKVAPERWETEGMQKVYNKYQAELRTAPGQSYTDVVALQQDGNPVKLSEVIGTADYVLVDFWASWCGPCKMIAPILDEISAERDDFKIAKINVDEQQELAIQFAVMSIPTLLVFKDGEVVNKSIGLLSKEEILKLI